MTTQPRVPLDATIYDRDLGMLLRFDGCEWKPVPSSSTSYPQVEFREEFREPDEGSAPPMA